MAEERSMEGNSAEPEKARKQDGTGHLYPTYGSESDRGNAEPQGDNEGAPAEHASRTIQGAAGPIEIVEDSGLAAGDLKREEEQEDEQRAMGGDDSHRSG